MRSCRTACLLLPLLAACSAALHAHEVCELPPRHGVGPQAAAIVRSACREHLLWHRPFIEADGRLASLGVTEAERAPLDASDMPAWQRVVMYWRDSGTLQPMAAEATPGAASCLAPYGERITDNDCRAFVLDTPWSAAFISWVMVDAGVAGFTRSARHMDYIARAYRSPDTGPYRYADPLLDKPAPGDLLCHLRGGGPALGASGLRAALDGGTPLPWQAHCDVVVAANPGGDRLLYLIGGNVLNAVTMRKLPLDRTGRLLPTSIATSAPALATAGDGMLETPDAGDCRPGNPDACSFNRRDWAALLKLREPGLTEMAPAGSPADALPQAAPAIDPPIPPAAGEAPAQDDDGTDTPARDASKQE